ncbi:transcription factor 23-like [Hypomesus transpacificus]|uniref:transcription factor 23-like n=1 Tax=Hypomesus transpacificus TaxID=137520 RepID=UPI001F07F4D8|nr:transcription factor 23-like [Hypomesus transpacificus]
MEASTSATPPGHTPATRSREAKKWVRSFPSLPPSRPPRPQHSPENAARERSRVRHLRQAFHSLQAALPAVPPDTKLSKLDVLVLAANYISHLTETLDQGAVPGEHTAPPRPGGFLHPVKKWPMRSLLYCGSVGEILTGASTNQSSVSGEGETHPLTPTSKVMTE